MIQYLIIQFVYIILSLVGVTSYQDITDSLKLVIKAVRFGQIKPWVCHLHFCLDIFKETVKVLISHLSPNKCKTLNVKHFLFLLHTVLYKVCCIFVHRSTGTVTAL